MNHLLWIIAVFVFGWIDHQNQKRKQKPVKQSRDIIDYLFRDYH